MKNFTSIFFWLIMAVIITAATYATFANFVALGVIAIAAFLLMFLFMSMVNPFKIVWHTIHEGWHYSLQGFLCMAISPFARLYNFNKNTINYRFMIPSNAYYDDNGVQWWNKIFGIVLKGGIHKNSIRVAWRPIEGNYTEYEICFYYYLNGEGYKCTKAVVVEYGKTYFGSVNGLSFQVYDEDLQKDSSGEMFNMMFAMATFMPYITKYAGIALPYIGGKGKDRTADHLTKIKLELDKVRG